MDRLHPKVWKSNCRRGDDGRCVLALSCRFISVASHDIQSQCFVLWCLEMLSDSHANWMEIPSSIKFLFFSISGSFMRLRLWNVYRMCTLHLYLMVKVKAVVSTSWSCRAYRYNHWFGERERERAAEEINDQGNWIGALLSAAEASEWKSDKRKSVYMRYFVIFYSMIILCIF